VQGEIRVAYIDVQKACGPLAWHEARVFSTAQHGLIRDRAQPGPASVPGSTAISAHWAGPSTTQYFVSLETGPLQPPTPNPKQPTSPSGPAGQPRPPAAQPPSSIYRRRGRRCLASPVTLILSPKSYRASHLLGRSSPLLLPSRLSSTPSPVSALGSPSVSALGLSVSAPALPWTCPPRTS
jgi:hypothetical protein